MQASQRRRLTERALGLAALVCRGHLESAGGHEKAREMYDLVLQWLEDTGAWHGLDDEEAGLLRAPLGTLDRGHVARALFRAEQLGVVAWACGVAPIARHDQHPHDRFLAQRVSFLRRDAVVRLERASPRDPELIRSAARVAIAVEDRLHRFAIDGKPLDFIEKYGLAPQPIAGGDLAFGGLPLHAVPEERWQLALAAAVERATAARWIVALPHDRDDRAPQRVVVPRLDGDA